jgi:hypothetical protein
MKIDQVLDEYRQGDPDKRLSLFLYHRDLRDEFSCIEQDDRPACAESLQTAGPPRKTMVQRVLFMLRNRSCRLRSRTSVHRAAP